MMHSHTATIQYAPPRSRCCAAPVRYVSRVCGDYIGEFCARCGAWIIPPDLDAQMERLALAPFYAAQN